MTTLTITAHRGYRPLDRVAAATGPAVVERIVVQSPQPIDVHYAELAENFRARPRVAPDDGALDDIYG